jgi:hypothetical protein
MKNIIYLILVFTSIKANAQFNLAGPPTVVWANSNLELHTISDREGGFFSAFAADYLSSTNRNIYLQRLDAAGNKLWGDKGIKVSDRPEDEGIPFLVLGKTTSGQKRLMVFWYIGGKVSSSHQNSYSLFAQSFSMNGQPQWAENGILVSNDFYGGNANRSYDILPTLNENKMVIAFPKFYNPGNIRLQTLNVNDGSLGFANNGIVLDNTKFSDEVRLSYTDDNSGKMMIAWGNYWSYYPTGLRAQIFNPINNNLLFNNYFVITPSINNSHYQQHINLAGNTIAWRDNRDGNREIYVQKVNMDGTPAWTTSGVRVTNMANEQSHPKMTQTSDGTTYLTWENTKETSVDSLYCYVTKINPDGTFPWGKNGIRISETKYTGYAYSQEILDPAISIINDTVVVFYKDNGMWNSNNTNAYVVQKITPEGRLLYGNKGQQVAGNYYTVNINHNSTNVIPTSDKGFVLSFNGGHRSLLAKVIPCPIPPLKPIVTHAKLCTSGANALLTATACSGTINWYEDDLVTRIHSGDSLLILSVTAPASYYAECISESGCASLDLTKADIILLQDEKNIAETYTASNSPADEETVLKITSTSKIQNTARVDFTSKSITMEPGFEVQRGGVFKAMARICVDN